MTRMSTRRKKRLAEAVGGCWSWQEARGGKGGRGRGGVTCSLVFLLATRSSQPRAARCQIKERQTWMGALLPARTAYFPPGLLRIFQANSFWLADGGAMPHNHRQISTQFVSLVFRAFVSSLGLGVVAGWLEILHHPARRPLPTYPTSRLIN